MKVLFVNENIGGHATVHHHLRRELAAHPEVQADFVDVPPPRTWRRIAGARVPGLGRLDLDLQPLRAQLAGSAWVRRRLRRKVDDYDAVHVYTHNTALLSAGVLDQVPSVVSLDTTTAENAYRLPHRSPTRFTPLTVAASRPFERRVLRAASVVVANSDWCARTLTDRYGLDRAQMRVLPFGIGAPEFDPIPAPGTASRAGRPTIVFVGRQLERKGGSQLARLHRSHLVDRADLKLVTHDRVPTGPGVDVVSDLAPGDPRLWEILRSASIFAFPSGIDQAPNVVLEAMAAGLPVVAVDTAAVPEMVVHEKTGLLVRAGDDDELLAALERLIADPDLCGEMGAAGRARFEAHYDARISTAALVAILGAAVASGRRGRGRS